jgi:hypothetical protein
MLAANVEVYQLLYFDWFRRLLQDAGIASNGCSMGDVLSIDGLDGFQVTANRVNARPFLRFESNDPERENVVQDLARQANARLEAGDFGGIVWYSTTLTSLDFQASQSFALSSLLERINNRIRFVGWCRLGGNILLEFAEELPPDRKENADALPPTVHIHVHVVVPAPIQGAFASRIAHSAVEIASVSCTFALMRAVDLPVTVWPSKPDASSALSARNSDTTLPSLARKGMPLDIAGAVLLPGGHEYFSRLRAALLTFDAAIHQRHDLVACILFVVVAECLAVPNVEWKESQVTKRFIEFYDELMPTVLDGLVAHLNLESLFAIRRGTKQPRTLRRELLSEIYAFRSGYVHQGLPPSYRSFVGSPGPEDVRRGFFSEFAEGAILEYMKAPRCSLIGHPKYMKSGASPAAN